RGDRAEPRKERTDALELSGNVLGAGVGIALQLRVAEHPVLQDADLVERAVRLQQIRRPLAERTLERGKGVHLRFELLHARFPRLPAPRTRREIPSILRGNLGTVAGRGLRVFGVQAHGRQHHGKGDLHFFSRARISVSMSTYFQNSRSTGWRW